MKKENVWLITAKTNLHVGNENQSCYGIIDKAIQRDALTDLPCINSSSLKGAINEYCSHGDNGKGKLDSLTRSEIFGSDKNKGKYVFFDAQILFLPVPSTDGNSLYNLVTSEAVLDRLYNQVSLFGIDPKEVKDILSIPHSMTKNHSEFCELCNNNNLPIIARNCLNDGKSTNLWYEQVLPPETVLYTMIDPHLQDEEDKDKLEEILNDKIVQIGANATIGYGYCRFKHLKSQTI